MDYYAGCKLPDYAKIVSNCIHHVVVKKSFIVLSGLLLLSSASSMAMSLGRHSGATLIGRPLDISVQAVLEPQEDVGSLCLEADVFYADNKIDKSRVRVTLEKSASVTPQALIRIRSTALVDEPVVTIYLRAGCQLKTERRYVSLAELVSEALPDRSMPAPMPSAASVRPAVIRPLNAATLTVEAAAPGTAKPVKRSRSRASAVAAPMEAGSATSVETVPVSPAKEQAQTPKTKQPRTPLAANDSKSATPAKARLKLEPLDLMIERDPQLKSSAELLSIPAANPQERAAASALWRALSAQPQDILRDTEKLETLEKSVRSLQAQGQKTLLSIDDLNVKLQQAQSERYANALIYALLALLLAAMAGLAYLLRHRLFGRRAESGDKPWWRKNDVYESHHEAWIDSSPPHDSYDLGAGRSSPLAKSKRLDVNVDFDIDPAVLKPMAIRPAVTPNFADSVPFEHKDKSGFGSSMMHPTRTAKAEELFDVQQQADFFLSIGQHEQAIELLRSHISENHETSALVYLDLFNLYHELKRPAEYESLRLTFIRRFNAQIPAFGLYTNKNLGLEAYQLALSRIEALWPSPKVLDIIEESLFRRPDTDAEAFNLEAYRELLLLYSVAKEIISPESQALIAPKFDLPDRPDDSGHSRPMTFKSTAIQPLSANLAANQQAVGQNELTQTLAVSTIPPASQRLGLDINLNDLPTLDDQAVSNMASDARFLAGFDPVAPPTLDSAPIPPAKVATDADNLIDFEIFDVPQAASEKAKLPEV